ncbi:MAG: hypothetical protein ACTSQ4_07725 [Candidatus Heimdallarchaeaceae archaeon]
MTIKRQKHKISQLGLIHDINETVQNGYLSTLIKPKGKFDYADGACDPHRDLY